MEPVAVDNIMRAVISGAGVILAGALYALLFALGKLQQSRWLLIGSLVFYGGLVACVAVLAQSLHLYGYWRWLVAAMLVGYLLAPRAIWRLCVDTHADPGKSSDYPGVHSDE